MMELVWISALVGLALGLYLRVWIVAPAAAILATSSVVISAKSGQFYWAAPIYWLGSLTALELGYLLSSALLPVLLLPTDASQLRRD
jgi:hypothetical protein